MSKRKLPGALAHLLTIPLTFLLTLTLLLLPLSWAGMRVLTDRDLHASVALDEAVTQAQMERIGALVDATAEKQSFDPAALAELITPDAVQAYNLSVIDWWMGLMQPDPAVDAPEWDSEAIQEAVRADALFQESVVSTQRRTVARDQVAYPIGKGIKETVLPIRTQLLSIALPKVLEKVDVPAVITLLEKVPASLAAASGVLALLVLLLMHRRRCKGLMYLGSALAACGLMTLGLMGAVLLLNPCGMIAQASVLLAQQVGVLGLRLALPLGVISAVELVLGLVFIGVHQKSMRRFFAGSVAA